MSIRLDEILNLPSLRGMFEDLWQTSGLSLGLLDNQGRLVMTVGWQPVCSEFPRHHSEFASHCLLNHPEFLPAGEDTGHPREIRCRSGLIDHLLPIRCEGELVGWLMFGQFLDAPPEHSQVLLQAQELGCDPDWYQQQMATVPVVSREKVDNYLGFYQKLLHLLSEAGLRKLREEQVMQSLLESRKIREQTNTILRSVADALILIDPRGCVRMVNPAAAALLGGDADRLIGRRIVELLSDESFINQLGKAIAGEELSAPFDLSPGPDAFGRVLQARLATIREGGQGSSGVVVSLRDVTRDREIERLKDDFISTAAHELRTPITVILGYAEIMLDQMPALSPEQLNQYLGTICNRAEALTGIIAEMLDLSRMQSGQMLSLIMQPADLEALARELVDQHRLANSNHVIRLQVTASLPPVAFDPAKIRQVFDNLLSNACKFSPADGEIAVTIAAQHPDVLVTVADQGIGMTSEQVERVFDKFYRADASANAVSGLGLGMSLVKGIIEGHGGRIWVASAPGRGTTVSFTLPVGDWSGK